jgi:hypothetical protein
MLPTSMSIVKLPCAGQEYLNDWLTGILQGSVESAPKSNAI